MADRLNIHQLCKAANVTKVQLHQWVARGFFKPEEESQHGKARSFSGTEAMTLAVFAELIRLGIRHEIAAQHSGSFYLFKDDAALLVVFQGPVELIPVSERGAPPTKKKGAKFYDPDMPMIQNDIVRASKLGDYVSNPDVRAMAIVNLDNIEKRVLEALADGDADA